MSIPIGAIGRRVSLVEVNAADGCIVIGASPQAIGKLMASRKVGELDPATVQQLAADGNLWKIDNGTQARVLEGRFTEAGLVHRVEAAGDSVQGATGRVEGPAVPSTTAHRP